MNIIIHTDGACKGNPGPGGWGVILMSGQHRKELFGGEEHTTNNRMELLAAIKGLEALKGTGHNVELWTDSNYVVQGCNTWLKGWKAKNWRGSAGPVKNVDLWQRMDALLQLHTVNCNWYKGHSGIVENERCDTLANMGVNSL